MDAKEQSNNDEGVSTSYHGLHPRAVGQFETVFRVGCLTSLRKLAIESFNSSVVGT